MTTINNTIIDNIIVSGYLREHENQYSKIKMPALVKSVMSIYCKEYSIQSFGSSLETSIKANSNLPDTTDLIDTLNANCSNLNIFKANTNTSNINKIVNINTQKPYEDSSNLIDADDIIDIQKGTTHTLILTANGNVYAYGANDNGQCGLGKNITCIKQPTKIPFDCKIKAIACGTLHSLFIDSEGKLLVCGYNYCGQLGQTMAVMDETMMNYDSDLDSDSDECTDSEDSDDADFFEPQCEPIYKPMYNEYFKDNLDIEFKHVSAGSFHSLCLTTTGECYTFGHNGFGNLGNNSATEWGEGIEIPFKLKLNKNFVSASCGKNHSILLTDCNEIIVFGDNNSNQCANSIDEQQIEKPYVLSKEKEFGIRYKNCYVEQVICDDDESISVIDMYKRVIIHA